MPNVQLHLQYANFGDNWISWNLTIEVGSKELCAEERVSGKLYFYANVPNPDVANYAPPFLITLRSKGSRNIFSSAIVNNYGNADVTLDLRNMACGEYELSFDKAFSTNQDPRKLSAMFIKRDSAFRFDSNLTKISKCQNLPK
jgi:hypothetical protein